MNGLVNLIKSILSGLTDGLGKVAGAITGASMGLNQAMWAFITGMVLVLMVYGCGRMHGSAATKDRLLRDRWRQEVIAPETPIIDDGAAIISE